MKQRTIEWIEKVDYKYHKRQFKEPYRSTVHFCDWLEEIGYINKDSQLKIIDLGCGGGANIYYLGKRYPKSEFIGIDINPDLILSGNEFFQEQEVENCYLETGNIFNLKEDYIQEFDGIVSFQTLSWLPEFEEPLEAMTSLQAEWLALTSLFYDGPISCTIDVQDHEATSQPHHYNNIYSLPLVKDFLSDKGYSSFQFGPFEIDIDLPKPNTKGMGTYTKKLNKGRRLQISGPLLMPWYFVGAKQQKS